MTHWRGVLAIRQPLASFTSARFSITIFVMTIICSTRTDTKTKYCRLFGIATGSAFSVRFSFLLFPNRIMEACRCGFSTGSEWEKLSHVIFIIVDVRTRYCRVQPSVALHNWLHSSINEWKWEQHSSLVYKDAYADLHPLTIFSHFANLALKIRWFTLDLPRSRCCSVDNHQMLRSWALKLDSIASNLRWSRRCFVVQDLHFAFVLRLN